MKTTNRRRASLLLALTAILALPFASVKAADISETVTVTDPVTFIVSVTDLAYPSVDSGAGNIYAPTFTTQSKSATRPFDVWMKVNTATAGKIDYARRLCLLTLPSGYTVATGNPCASTGTIDSAGWGGGSAGTTGSGVKIFGRTTLDTTLRTTTYALGIQNLAAAPLTIGSYTGTVTLTLMTQ